MLAIDRERLKRLRDGLPDIGPVHEPRLVCAYSRRGIALGVRGQEDRAAHPAFWRRSGSRHEVAIEVDLERIGVAVDVDLLQCPAGLRRKRRRRPG